MANIPETRRIGVLRNTQYGSEIAVTAQDNKYIQTRHPTHNSAGRVDRYDNFPYINDGWRWVEVYPTATPEERRKIHTLRLLGADAYWRLCKSEKGR